MIRGVVVERQIVRVGLVDVLFLGSRRQIPVAALTTFEKGEGVVARAELDVMSLEHGCAATGVRAAHGAVHGLELEHDAAFYVHVVFGTMT